MNLSPGWAFIVGWAASTIVVAALMERACRRPITPEDEHCARVDAELDAADYAARTAAYAERIAAGRRRHPSGW